MAETQSLHRSSSTDPKSGYCSQTKIYRSLIPSVTLPPPSAPLSISSCAISSLLHSAALSTTAFLIDADIGNRLTYSAFLQQVSSLSSALKSSLSTNDVAFILSPPSLHIPILYFSLLSLGVAVSPSNPLSSPSELTHQIQLSKPSIAFSTSALAHKLPPNLPLILLDSPEFLSMLQSRSVPGSTAVNQSDTAVVLCSSGTTGKVKGVVLTHRNLIAVVTGLRQHHISNDAKKKAEGSVNGVYVKPVWLMTVPLFHVYGFVMMIRAVSLGESLVLMEKFDFVKMLEAVERYRVTLIAVAPPLVVAMTKSELVEKYDLSSLQLLVSGGAPLGEEVADQFRAKLPHVVILQDVSSGERFKIKKSKELGYISLHLLDLMV